MVIGVASQFFCRRMAPVWFAKYNYIVSGGKSSRSPWPRLELFRRLTSARAPVFSISTRRRHADHQLHVRVQRASAACLLRARTDNQLPDESRCSLNFAVFGAAGNPHNAPTWVRPRVLVSFVSSDRTRTDARPAFYQVGQPQHAVRRPLPAARQLKLVVTPFVASSSPPLPSFPPPSPLPCPRSPLLTR